MFDIAFIMAILGNLAAGLNEAHAQGKLWKRKEKVVAKSAGSIDELIAEGMVNILFIAICTLVFIVVAEHVSLPKIPRLLVLSAISAIGILIPIRQHIFSVLDSRLQMLLRRKQA